MGVNAKKNKELPFERKLLFFTKKRDYFLK